jgi:glycosyltransferase involved in cell wall biosynthesis
MSPKANVSVVIPARNAARTLGRQLAAIAAQTYDGEVEVVVVDNDSADETVAIANSAPLANLRVVSTTARHNAAHARNVGIAAATHDLILGCDADDVVDGRWIEAMVAASELGGVVSGGSVDWDGGAFPIGVPKAFGRAGFGFLPSFGGCSFAVHRDVWAALEGFDEELVACEDIDFGWRAQLAGYVLVTRPEAFVYYFVSPHASAQYRKWRRDGMFQPALYARFRRHGQPRQRVTGAVGRWLRLIGTCYQLCIGNEEQRRAWCREAGRRVGRLIGSIRFRALYL